MDVHQNDDSVLINFYEETLEQGILLSKEKLEACYQTFNTKFGPETLRNLVGEELLEVLHGRGTNDSLMYWLEFKNDDEFPSYHFGGIGGGSALKFGIYKNKETGKWMTGAPSTQRGLDLVEAIEIANEQKKELLAGCKVLDTFNTQGSEEDYKHLQEQLDTLAPKVSSSSWGHKYFSLIYPDSIPDLHTEYLQRFYTIKLEKKPPTARGRYAASGLFVRLARGLNIPLNHVTKILGGFYGDEHSYWRIGTTEGDTGESHWENMRDANCVAIGWEKIPDLSNIQYRQQDKDWIKEQVQIYHPVNPQTDGRSTQQLFNFAARIKENDLIVAAKGMTVLGVGRVIGGYFYQPEERFPHRRPVEWLSLEEWKMPTKEGLRTTVAPIVKHPENLVAVESHITTSPLVSEGPKVDELPALHGIPARIKSILDRKSQMILYGPPGTGKTYWAQEVAFELAARDWFGKSFKDLSLDERTIIEGSSDNEGSVLICCFSPAYGYEDFIEGFRPKKDGTGFQLTPGIFLRASELARKSNGKPIFLVIDEINRGDIPRIFGELMMVVEKDKRERTIMLSLSSKPFSVPENLYLIGTMNTADRSISLLDTALRRRFGFLELMPDSSMLDGVIIEGIPLGKWFRILNERIVTNVGRDARNLQVGHSYFLHNGKPITDWGRLSRVFQDDVIPLLEEYCYEDYDALSSILGPALVDKERQLINHRLFEPRHRSELIEAIRQIGSEELALSLKATESDEELVQEDEVEGEED